MSSHKLEQFLRTWEFESGLTVKLLRTLPKDQYDFRPDPEGRSLAELAWHLAEVEAIMTSIAASRKFDTPMPPGLERPSTVPELATGYERIHREAVKRVRAIRPEDLDREFPFFEGQPLSVRNVLWLPLLHHLIHHRGQLMMMIRMAHGVPSRVYGPTREDDAAVRARAQGR
jgi:uncharacterized damage-inducible protein DinB